eukprot:TRINITY_DN29470_c0_g1_i1.p1 TRINITY_DN29470_c0_g1~~TRINITY_DN29470_c0_g1_i1.p1  ORF type:complete len:309 (+),score=26.77 TRINITY_DN29470_c0_g1_i1:94-927(+)
MDIPAEVACSLCLDLLHDPISTSCKHVYCRSCLARVLATGHTICPLCRRSLRGFDTCTAATHAASISLIAQIVPSAIVARRALEALKCLEIIVGNLYEEVSRRDRNTNKWTMYVTLTGAAGQHTAKLIEKVVYQLHPTFRPSTVTAEPPNFSICRYGWGTFTVECCIHWVSWLGMAPTQVSHYLEFDGNGGRTLSSVEMNPSMLEQLHAEICPAQSRGQSRSLGTSAQSRRSTIREGRAAGASSYRSISRNARALNDTEGTENVEIMVGNAAERQES